MATLSEISGVHCSACMMGGQRLRDEDFRDYFEGRPMACRSCGDQVPLWDRLLAAMLSDNTLVPGIIALGLARCSIAQYPMVVDQAFIIDLEADAGIPPGATVLDVFLTPAALDGETDAPFPALMLQRLQTQAVPRTLALRPIQFPPEARTPGGTLNLLAIWIPDDIEPELAPLAYAAQAFANGDYRGVVVPANVAVESKLGAILQAHFTQFVGKGHVERFLNDAATYGHQLRILWPSLFAAAGATPFDPTLAGNLQRLRSLRNGVAHSHGTVERDEAARLLLTALFGYQYLNIFGSLLVAGDRADAH